MDLIKKTRTFTFKFFISFENWIYDVDGGLWKNENNNLAIDVQMNEGESPMNEGEERVGYQ